MLKEVDHLKFNQACKKELKAVKEIAPPDWSRFVKTGSHNKFTPFNDDWWYTRAASILRRLYLDGPVGVERLRTFYGGRKERGHQPERFRKAGGNHIRKILQQLETAGLVQKSETKQKGRILSKKGFNFMNKVAAGVKK
jgi:small subunit ribosomal protein S19e